MATIFDIEYNGYHHHHQHRNRRSRRLRRHWNDYRIQLMKTETFFFFLLHSFFVKQFSIWWIYSPPTLYYFLGPIRLNKTKKNFPEKKPNQLLLLLLLSLVHECYSSAHTHRLFVSCPMTDDHCCWLLLFCFLFVRLNQWLSEEIIFVLHTQHTQTHDHHRL